MVKITDQKEQYTAVLPRVRLKPSQLKQVHALATKDGFGKKISEFVRRRLLGEKIEEKPDGMPRQDVIANLPELANLRARLIDRPDLLPIIDRLSQRHRNALLHDPKIQHPR